MEYQDIRGTALDSGLEIADELDAMKEFEIDKPWSVGNKWKYQMMMDIMFKNSKTACSS